MGENKRLRPNDIDDTDSENRKRSCIEKDSKEDSEGDDNAKIPDNYSGEAGNMHGKQKHPPQRIDSLGSSNHHENNLTGFGKTGRHIANAGNATERGTFVGHDIDDGHNKARDHRVRGFPKIGLTRGIMGALPFLTAVRDRFGSKQEKYKEFFQIYSDFSKKVEGDEIIRRTKELFDGDEMIVMGFYRLLLEQKRKKKRPDDFGVALTKVCQLMTGENKRLRPNDIDDTDSENRKRSCIEKGNREDSKGDDIAKIPDNYSGEAGNMHCKQKNPQRIDSLGSSIHHENNLTGNATERGTFVGHDIDDGHNKARDLKHNKNKQNTRLGEKHSSDSNNSMYPANGKEFMSISEVDVPSCQTCTPSYQILPEELQVRLVSQRTELESSVLNDCCVVSVNNVDYSSKVKSNQYQDTVFKCEDDMYELDMLLEVVKATITNVKEMMTNEKIHPDFQFPIEKYLTTSNLRCIVNLYDTNWEDMVNAMRQNAKMMGIILHRLEQRQQELEGFRLDFYKICRDVFAENVPKLYKC